ncbi:MAG TPA: type II toxin-antitoxin system RelE/ParE family toxin [Terriglobia bacterium]|nr:type II toxin-antitoxin system RelE/ParE family toxin [Terriglobia bacterium]
MPRPAKFTIIYAPETVDHLSAVERKYHRLIRATVKEQLSYAPDQITRNRKPLDPPLPFGATWELRFGPQNRFRIFYEIDSEALAVWVLAVGVKEGNRLFIGREEFTP